MPGASSAYPPPSDGTRAALAASSAAGARRSLSGPGRRPTSALGSSALAAGGESTVNADLRRADVFARRAREWAAGVRDSAAAGSGGSASVRVDGRGGGVVVVSRGPSPTARRPSKLVSVAGKAWVTLDAVDRETFDAQAGLDRIPPPGPKVVGSGRAVVGWDSYVTSPAPVAPTAAPPAAAGGGEGARWPDRRGSARPRGEGVDLRVPAVAAALAVQAGASRRLL